MTPRHLPVAGEVPPQSPLMEGDEREDLLQLGPDNAGLVAFGYDLYAQAIVRARLQPVRHSALVLLVNGLYRKTCTCGWFSIGSGTSLEAWNTSCERLDLERLIEGRILRDGALVIDALRGAARESRAAVSSTPTSLPPGESPVRHGKA